VASGAGETLAERITNHRIFASLQLVGFVLLAAACAAFTRQAYASRETLTRCLAGVAAIAAVARLSSIGDPSVVSSHLYPSDALRIASYLVLGVLGAREMVTYRQRLASAAVAEERRRLACELHDGLAQELAFIASKAESMLDDGLVSRDMNAIASAADRALIESRCAIAALTSDDDSLTTRIARTAEALAGREGARALFVMQEGLDASAPVTEALVRIVGEAVTNAIRHGGVDTVDVRLSRDDKLRLVVQDRGRGFDPLAAAPGRLGITTMRQRAVRVGGEIYIRSRPGAGTQIEVVVP
jgi:signal transduction histidine kinase